MKLHRIFRRWGGILFLIAIPPVWELLLLFAPQDSRRHLRPYLHCVQAAAFAGFGYWFSESGLRLRRMQNGSFWQKSWPSSLVLGLATIPASIAFLIFCIVGLVASH
jgi:hypothetical protein